MNDNFILRLQNITKSFGDTQVLRGISIDIRQGEFITFLGSSGCGKTTTLRIIAGLEEPDSGAVLLEGRDVTALAPNKRDVNTVFQSYALFPHMTVEKNIAYVPALSKSPLWKGEERRRRAAELLESADNYDKTAVLMGKVKKYLQHNYMVCDISLDSVSAILNLNASYFSALFKRTFQVNFLDYLTELRMEAAKELLHDPLRSTAEVANMVGYESANYFTRAFKKKVGVTPTDYRRGAARGRGGGTA